MAAFSQTWTHLYHELFLAFQDCASKTLRLKDFYCWFLLLLHIINAIHFECNVPDIFMFDNGNLLGKCHQE